MSKKPDCKTVMLQIIKQAASTFPFADKQMFKCMSQCENCPKKLLELIEMDMIYWQSAIKLGRIPNLAEVSRFSALCKKVGGILVQRGLLTVTA